MYLGEITRLVLLDLMEKGLIFVNETQAALYFAERIALVHSKDGSGKGAGIIAAVAALSEKGRNLQWTEMLSFP